MLSSKALKKIGINAIFLQQIGIPLLMDEMDNILPSWVLYGFSSKQATI
ncbi:hypothetical protein [Selenomonas sp.]|nr:hypothetical protein [Selenomonas sp.]